MEEDRDKSVRSPSDPATVAEFAGESSWSLGADDSDCSYFYSGNRERSILSEFGWNLDPVHPNRIGSGVDGFWLPAHSAPSGSVDPVDTVAAATSSRSNNQSVSTSSSEDPPEKSTVSDEKPPPEIP